MCYMPAPLPMLHRAYELAKSGEVASVQDVRRELKREGYLNGEIAGHLAGRTLCDDLRSLIKVAEVWEHNSPSR